MSEPTGARHEGDATAAGPSGTDPSAPSDDELAALMAAVELAWPRPAVAQADEEPPRWRFSGRWWSKPLPARRDRP